MMKNAIFFLLIFAVLNVCANEVDSLRQQLQQVDENQHAQAYSALGYAFEKAEVPDSAFFYYRKAVGEAKHARQVDIQGRNLRYQGMLHLAQAAHDSAQMYLKQALGIFQIDSLRLDRAKTWVDLGNVYYHLGIVDSAASTYLQAASLFDELGMKRQAGIVYGNLGTLHMELAHLKEAIFYHKLNYHRSYTTGLNRHTARAAYNLGGAYDAADELFFASSYYDTALFQAQILKDTLLLGYCHMGIASVLSKGKKYNQAVEQMQAAWSYAHDIPTQATVLNHFGYYLGFAGKYEEAKEKFQQAQALCLEHNLSLAMRENLDFWREAAAVNGRFEDAYRQLMAYRILDDSVRSQQLEARIYELEIRYESARKEQENFRLQAQNAAQQLQLQQMESKIQTRGLSLLLTFSLLSLGGIGFYFFRKNTLNSHLLAVQDADLQRQRADQLKQGQRFIAAQAMVEGQESERARLAREIHDGLGGLLASILRMLEQGTEAAKVRAIDLLKDASQELRRIAYALMPASLARLGLKAALEDLLLAQQSHEQASIDLQIYGLESPIPDAVRITLFRIVQELVHNMHKHAQAKEVFIQIIHEPTQIHLSYEDDGLGFDPQQATGIGLRSIQQRVAFLAGSFELEAAPHKGVAVYISLPIHNRKDTV